jgi:hypothetical protein
VEHKQYRYWIVAVNSYGEGQPSVLQVGTPEPGGIRPTSPHYILYNVSGTVAVLQISSPSDNPTAQYIIERRMRGQEWKEIDRVNYHTETYYDESLVPNTTYEYRMKGVNIAGESDYGPIVIAQTNASQLIPTNFTWTVNSATQITLKWKDLPCEEYYTVQVLNERGEVITLVQLNPNTTSWVVPGLSPERGYYFILSAYADNSGGSAFSDLVKTYNDPKRDLF